MVRRAAPAKINLYLHLIGKRADGYHLLDSLVAFADVGDVLEVRPAAGLTLAISGPFAKSVPDDVDNMVMRAARSLAAAGGVREGAAIALKKHLPVSAGLGGGSADAAAALLALAELWRLRPGEDGLKDLGLALGADVPACLAGRVVYVGGIGEAIAPAPALPRAQLVLANPGVAVDTARVFAAHRGMMSGPGRFDHAPATAAALAEALISRRNDLQAPAEAIAPVISEVLSALEAQPGCLLARLSGSGASCFGLFAEERAAAEAAEACRAAHPGWWVVATPLIDSISSVPARAEKGKTGSGP